MIDPGIWRNKGILRVSRDARLLFIGLITYADDCGYGDADPMALRASIFPGDSDVSDTDVERYRDELVTAKLVEISNDLYRLPGWSNFQKIRSDYKLEEKYKQRWNGPVTDPLRHSNGPEPQYNTSKDNKDNTSKEKCRSAKPTFIIPQNWLPVFEILSSIDARSYRTLKFDQDWIDRLDEFAQKLDGAEAVTEEAKKFKHWLIGRLSNGDEKRDKRHNPRARFLNTWLGNAVKYKLENAGEEQTPEQAAAAAIERNKAHV